MGDKSEQQPGTERGRATAKAKVNKNKRKENSNRRRLVLSSWPISACPASATTSLHIICNYSIITIIMVASPSSMQGCTLGQGCTSCPLGRRHANRLPTYNLDIARKVGTWTCEPPRKPASRAWHTNGHTSMPGPPSPSSSAVPSLRGPNQPGIHAAPLRCQQPKHLSVRPAAGPRVTTSTRCGFYPSVRYV